MSKIFDCVTNPIHSQNIILTILLLFSIIVAVLAIYGGVRICTLQEKFETIKTQQVKIAELKEEICWLREMADLSTCWLREVEVNDLSQILTPLQVNELKVLNERIRQDKYRQLITD